VSIENQLEQLIKEIRSLTKKLDKSVSTGTGPAASSSTSAFDEENDAREENLRKRKDANAQLKKDLEENKKLLKQMSATTLGYQLLAQTVEDQTKQLQEGTEAVEKQADALKNLNEAQTAAAGLANDLAGAFGIVSADSTMLGRALKVLSNRNFKDLDKQLQKSFSNANLAASSFKKLTEAISGPALLLFNDYQDAITSFNQQTGMLDAQMKSRIEDAADDMMRYGVSFQDTSNAMSAFVNSTIMADSSIRANSTALAQSTALMSKFGVSAESTAANMEILVRSLGMSGEAAISTQEDIAKLGIQLGIGASAATNAFQQALPRLALYGDDTVGIFTRAATAATKLGMSVDEVVTIGEKFQTFQGAAEAAGSLNAILGGGFIDNIELMEASFEDPAGAALLLRDRIKESGMAIEDLGTMGIKAIGEKLGITDPATVRKFLQGDLTGEDLMKAANDPVVNSLEDLADQSQTLGQKQLNMMKDQTHELAKMVGGLDKIDETARGILSEIGGLTGTLILGVTQIVGAIMTRSAVSGLAGGLKGAAQAAAGTAAAGSAAAGAATTGAAGTAATAAGGTALAGAGLALAGVAAAAGLGALLYYGTKEGPAKVIEGNPPPPAAASAARKVSQVSKNTAASVQQARTSFKAASAQTDTLIKETNRTLTETNRTLEEVRSALSDIRNNTSKTGKDVADALRR
jgi:hypothetical protein